MKRLALSTWLSALFFAIACLPAHAVQPDEVLSDPVLEKRARALSAGLRCLVCQNQSIDDSNAPLAVDLRRIVRERLEANDTDAQVIDYVVARYGEFVLLKPPLKPETVLLWASPLVILLLGLMLARRAQKQTETAAGAGPLDAAEQAELDRILKQGDGTAS